MRIIDLDFYADKGGSIFLGYAGEHLSTVLNFHMPAEFSKDNCLYLVNFETDDGQVLGGSTPQEPQTVGEPTADSLIAFRADRDSNIVKYYVPNTVVGATAHTGKFQLSVYGLDVTNNNYKLLGYSTQFSYVIDNAINIGTSISFSNDFTAALDDLLSAIEGIGNFSELSEEYTDLVSRISEVLSNIEDNYAQKDYIVSYSLPAQSGWTQITGGYTLKIDTDLIPGYTFTNKTKIDIEPTVELYSTLERSFCTGLYAETEENEEIITYKFVALNKAPNTPIDVQLKLSEVNYSEE